MARRGQLPQGFCGRASPVWARLGCREGFFKLVRNLCTWLRPVREAALPSARCLGFLLKVDISGGPEAGNSGHGKFAAGPTVWTRPTAKSSAELVASLIHGGATGLTRILRMHQHDTWKAVWAAVELAACMLVLSVRAYPHVKPSCCQSAFSKTTRIAFGHA